MLTYTPCIKKKNQKYLLLYLKDFIYFYVLLASWGISGTNGGVGSECSLFLATLAEKLSFVRGGDVNDTMEWLRAKLSF